MQDVVPHLLDFIHRVSDAIDFESPKIAGLTAPTRIKSGTVKGNSTSFGINSSDDSGKFLEIRIGLVKEFGHMGIIADGFPD